MPPVRHAGSSAAEPLPDLPTGALVADRYRVEAKLGNGRYGSVYQVTDTLLEYHPLALKVLPAKHPAALTTIARQYQARKQIRSFDHVLMADQPSSARFADAELLVYPMDLADGGNLRDRIEALAAIEDRATRQDAVLDLFRQMCDGVHACHEAGIVHLNLKPENFLLHEDRVKVTDFGIAGILGPTLAAQHGPDTEVYLAPEQRAGTRTRDVDHRTDIYALGIILREFLSAGTRAYEGADERHTGQPEPKQLAIEPALQAIVEKMTASEPDDRYRAVSDMLSDLAAAVNDIEVGTIHVATPSSALSLWRDSPSLFVNTFRGDVIRQKVCIRFCQGNVYVATACFHEDCGDKDIYFSGAARTFPGPLRGHTAYVASLAFDRQCRFIAAGDKGGDVWVWTNDGAIYRQTLKGHSDHVTAVAFGPYGPDGLLLASGSFDRTIRLWNIRSGDCVRTLDGYWEPVYAVLFSRDFGTLAGGYADGSIQLWNPHSGDHVRSLTGHTDVVSAMAFSPDGNVLASASDDNTVRLWDPHSGRHLRTLEEHVGAVYALAFSPDGTLLASGSRDQSVILWDVGSGELVHDLVEDEFNSKGFQLGEVLAVSFESNAALYIAASTLIRWSVQPM